MNKDLYKLNGVFLKVSIFKFFLMLRYDVIGAKQAHNLLIPW